MSVYDTYKKSLQGTTQVPEVTPQQEGIIKRAARAVLPKKLEDKIIGPVQTSTPPSPVSVYEQFKSTKTGASGGSVYDRFKGREQTNLGELSAKYESSGRADAVGYDTTGGWSYGTHQLTQNNVGRFLQLSGYSKQFGNLKPGTPQFNVKWQEVARNDPQFKDAQERYIRDTHFNPQSQMLKALGIPLKKYGETLQQVIYSTAVQHGPNNDVVKKALQKVGKDASEEELIKAIYEERWAGGKRFASSTPEVRQSVFKRFFGPNGELQTALKKIKEKTGIGINLPHTESFKKPSQEGYQKTVENFPIMRLLNSNAGRKVISEVAGKTDDAGLKFISSIEALSPSKTYKEAYEAWKKKASDPNNNELEKILYGLQSAGPQSAIGVALSFIPYAGVPLSTAYWTALSADEQIKKHGRVTSPGNIAIDVVGDRMLGSALEGILKAGGKTFINTVAKTFGIEGGTETLQTVLKLGNDYQNAKTPEEKKQTIEEFKRYITSGDILREFAIGGFSGAGIGAGGYAVNKIVSQGQNQVNIEGTGSPEKPQGTVYERFKQSQGQVTNIEPLEKLEEVPSQPSQKAPKEITPAKVTIDDMDAGEEESTVNKDIENTSETTLQPKEESENLDTKTSKVASSVEAKALKERIAESFKDLAQYTPTTIEKQTTQALALIKQDYTKARRILRGEESLPEGLLGGTMIKVMEDYAMRTGDVGLLQDIANSPLTSETSVHAQEMRMLAERDPDSPVVAIMDVVKAREKRATRRMVNVRKAKTRIAADIKAEIKKRAPKKETWESFIESIKC